MGILLWWWMVFGNTERKNLLLRSSPRERMDLKNLLHSFKRLSSRKKYDWKQKASKPFQERVRSHSKGRSFQEPPISLMKESFFQRSFLLAKGKSYPDCVEGRRDLFSDLGMVFLRTKVQSASSSLILDGFIREGNVNLFTWGSIDLKQLFSLMKSPSRQRRCESRWKKFKNSQDEQRFVWNGSGRLRHGWLL